MSKETLDQRRLVLNIHPTRFTRFARKLKWFFFVYLGRPKVCEILTKNGLLKFWSKDKTTGRILHVYRNHEYEEIKNIHAELVRLGKLTREKSTVLDVGGYIGMSSTAFLIEGLFEYAYVFEPCPRNFELLKTNTSLNSLTNRLLPFNVALSDKSGFLEFELSEKNYGDNRVRKCGDQDLGAFGEAGREVVKVPATTLDDFLAKHTELNEKSIGLVWMDIQGHEPSFLQGAVSFLQRNPGTPIFMEFWPYGMRRSQVNLKPFFDLCSREFHSFSCGTRYRPIDELSNFFNDLEFEAKTKRDPGWGAQILLI